MFSSYLQTQKKDYSLSGTVYIPGAVEILKKKLSAVVGGKASNDNEQLVSYVLGHLSEEAANLFLSSLDVISHKEQLSYVKKWLNFLEKLVKEYPLALQHIHSVFLKHYSWHLIYLEELFSIVNYLATLNSETLWYWFEKYFKPIGVMEVKKNVLQRALQKFKEFIDCCKKHGVHQQLSGPPSTIISFQIDIENYLTRCIFALEQASNKQLQAQFLNNLPKQMLIESAFNKKLPFICSEFLCHNSISIIELEKLADSLDYSSYRPSALVHLANNTKINFSSCLKFFNELNQIEPEKINNNEKLMLAKAFVSSVCFKQTLVSIKAYIYWASELKERLGIDYFITVFERLDPRISLDEYITICQFLIDINDLKEKLAKNLKTKEANEETSDDIQWLEGIDLKNILMSNKETPDVLIDQLTTCKDELLSRCFPQRELSDVLNAFQTRNEFVKHPLPASEFSQLSDDYREIESIGIILRKQSLTELIRQAQQCGQNLSQQQDDKENSLLLISIIREVVRYIFKIYPHNTQVLSILALIHKPPERRGRIAQICTGEGKSIIIAMLTTYLACQGKCIDIITSSRYLAIRDQRKFSRFFNTFNITSSHISYVEPQSKHFNAQILYGTNYDFEFSILRDPLYNTKLRYTELNGKLEKRPCEVVIVDEVDNLFLDTALNSARMSISSPESTSWVYEPILKFVLKHIKPKISKIIVSPSDREAIENISQRDIDQFKVTDEVLSQLKEKLTTYYKGRYSEQIKQFSDDRLRKWINSAKSAMRYRKGRNYVVKLSADTCDDTMVPKVIIVDYQNTGRLNIGSRWGGGVHEFVEVINGLTPEDESLTAASLSHPAFFNYYQVIYGLTGTMGENQERKEIEKVYNVDTFDVPPHLPSQRKREEDSCLDNEENYLRAIIERVRRVLKEKRPVLILFNTITQSETFSKLLLQYKINHQVLNEMQQEDEEYVIARAGKPCMVTVATNTAGRGTDIILAQEAKEAGGLYAIFAFYPENTRVEGQGLGRAARQGDPGTCCVIIHSGDKCVRDLLDTKNVQLPPLNDSKKVFNLLRELRSQKVTELSNQRVSLSHRETIHNSILNFFFEILDFCNRELQELDLSTIANACKQVKIDQNINVKSNLCNNPSLELLSNELEILFNQQVLGVNISWQSFLNRLKMLFLRMIQQTWAKFFTSLSDDSPMYLIWSGRYDQYEAQLFKKFYNFFNDKLRQYLENPQKGFLLFFTQLLKKSTDASTVLFPIVPQEIADFFIQWQEKLKEKISLQSHQSLQQFGDRKFTGFDNKAEIVTPDREGNSLHLLSQLSSFLFEKKEQEEPDEEVDLSQILTSLHPSESMTSIESEGDRESEGDEHNTSLPSLPLGTMRWCESDEEESDEEMDSAQSMESPFQFDSTTEIDDEKNKECISPSRSTERHESDKEMENSSDGESKDISESLLLSQLLFALMSQANNGPVGQNVAQRRPVLFVNLRDLTEREEGGTESNGERERQTPLRNLGFFAPSSSTSHPDSDDRSDEDEDNEISFSTQ